MEPVPTKAAAATSDADGVAADGLSMDPNRAAPSLRPSKPRKVRNTSFTSATRKKTKKKGGAMLEAERAQMVELRSEELAEC